MLQSKPKIRLAKPERDAMRRAGQFNAHLMDNLDVKNACIAKFNSNLIEIEKSHLTGPDALVALNKVRIEWNTVFLSFDTTPAEELFHQMNLIIDLINELINEYEKMGGK